MLQTDPRYPGWVQGWGVIKGESPDWTCFGAYGTRQEALDATVQAGQGYTVRWGSYNESSKQFVSGDPI
ncbi:MAG TPA: hypothetical protein VND87_18625 [Stellaceae bacterium]|nr:hypothetical protein [Stellaceae bacterium]